MTRLGWLFVLFALAGAAFAAAPAGPIFDGSELDYQPSIVRTQSGDLIIVFERLSQSTFSGDLYQSTSADDGSTWSTPQPIIASPANERHPALLQLHDGSFVLFYLKDEGFNSFRIHRATSADGSTWFEAGRVELGWPTSGEINPDVILAPDGTLTMAYHRLSGPSYIAQSADGGATWDALRTQVSPGTAQLPRLAYRPSDGLYLLTYQVGGSFLTMYSKVSADPYDWNVAEVPFSTAANSHDSKPIVLADDTFLVTYIQQQGFDAFDVYYRYSQDSGVSWSGAVPVTADTSRGDFQPHPLLSAEPDRLLLAWSHQESGLDQDVWFRDDIPLPFVAAEVRYVSLDAAGSVGGISYGSEDVLAFAGGAWSLFFDGSAHGLSGADVDAFHRLADGRLLLSFAAETTVPGIGTVASADIVLFNPASATFLLALDGSDVGLDGAAENVDAITTTSTYLVVSTTGAFDVPGLSGDDEDLIRLENPIFGPVSSGEWALQFDGSTVGLGGDAARDIDAAHWAGDTYHLASAGAFTLGGFPIVTTDVGRCAADGGTGCLIAGAGLFWAAAQDGLAGNIDALAISDAGAMLALPAR